MPPAPTAPPITDDEPRDSPRVEIARSDLARLQQLAALAQTAAGIAHETRNVLGGILGLAQLARAQPAAPDTDQRAFEAIERDALRGVTVLVRFLDLARIPAVDRAPVSIADLLADLLPVVRHPLQARQLELAVDLEPGLPTIDGRGDELRQVLLNLLLNAADATPVGGRIAVTAATAGGGELELVVADSGPGVPIELRQRVFEPFFTTKASGEGSGLGLALCKRVIEEHGGTILVTAGAVGARLVIRLPTRRAGVE